MTSCTVYAKQVQGSFTSLNSAMMENGVMYKKDYIVLKLF